MTRQRITGISEKGLDAFDSLVAALASGCPDTGTHAGLLGVILAGIGSHEAIARRRAGEELRRRRSGQETPNDLTARHWVTEAVRAAHGRDDEESRRHYGYIRSSLDYAQSEALRRLRNRSEFVRLLIDTRVLKLGIGQAEVARRCEVSQSWVRKWEHGESVPPRDIFGPLASALGLNEQALLIAESGSAALPPTEPGRERASDEDEWRRRLHEAYWHSPATIAQIAQEFDLRWAEVSHLGGRLSSDWRCGYCGRALHHLSREARSAGELRCSRCSTNWYAVPEAGPRSSADTPDLVLHGVWAESRLWLWAEVAAPDLPPPGGPTRRPVVRPHPFAASGSDLTGGLASLGVEPADIEQIPLDLPSIWDRPLPSRLDPAEHPTGLRAQEMATWTVSACRIDGAGALDFLLGLPAHPGGVVVGNSLRFLAHAARFGLSLVANGRILPRLERGCARWRPIEDERLGSLLASAPTAAVMAPEDDRDAPVRELVEAVVDHVARSALAGPNVIEAGRRSNGEAFLAALSVPDATVHASSDVALAGMARKLAGWKPRQHSAVLTTCFRLTEPAEGAEGWTLEVLVCPDDEPSLLIPAGELSAGTASLRLLQRRVVHPLRSLQESVTMARSACPVLAETLTGQGTATAIDLATAVRFLREAAPVLEELGFRLLLPSWWGSKPKAMSARLRTRSRRSGRQTSSGLFGVDSLCDYRWGLAIGEHALTQEEMDELARLKQPLVRFRGEWLELSPDQVEAAVALLISRGEDGWAGQISLAETVRAQLGMGGPDPGLPVTEVETEGWLGELLAAGDHTLSPVPTPKAFVGTLRHYQERGLAWLWFLDRLGLGGCLADDMGLGKTPQVLALLLLERELLDAAARASLGPTLVVCPMSVIENWLEEVQKFAPSLRACAYHGGSRSDGEGLGGLMATHDLVVTSYGIVARDVEVFAEAGRWHRVVLDEAQDVNNGETAQSRAARSVPTSRRLALTGTPVENNLRELWTIIDFCLPGLLGPKETFMRCIGTPIEREGDEEKAELLRRVIGPFVLRRLKTDKSIAPELPEKDQQLLYCHLTEEQASLYQAVVDEMLASVDSSEGIRRRGLVLAGITKLKQVCNHPAHLLGDGSAIPGRSGKLAQLEALVDEALAGNEKVLIFTHYEVMGTLLQRHLQRHLGEEILWMCGATSKNQRTAMRKRFADPDGPRVMLLTLQVGGRGLNLISATRVVHYDRWWSPAREDQGTDRAYRIGQTRAVQVRCLVSTGTIEERIDELLVRKRALRDKTVGSGERWITELSTAELRDLVRLSPAARTA